MGKLAVNEYIKKHEEQHIRQLQEFVQQPSISATGHGIDETAQLVAQYLRDLGCQEVEIVPTDGHPSVFGYYDAGAEKTIVNYGMYDVNPVNDREWDYDPFSGDVITYDGYNKVLYGRGAFFQKGPLRAWLNALESIVAVEGTLPVNIYFVIDGEEEIGSPHFHQVISRYHDRLTRADAALTLGVAQNQDGDLSMFLGNKGFVYFELEANGANWGRGPRGGSVHGSTQSIVDSPAWRLVHALASLTDVSGRDVLISGFGDDIASPSENDISLLQGIVDRFKNPNWNRIIPNLGPGEVTRFVEDKDGIELLLQYLYTPTFNIDGLYGGYTGPGTPTFSLPDKVVANMDIRIVPNQEPDDVRCKLRAHLDDRGFEDIELRVISSYTWAKTDVSNDIVQSCIRAYKRLGIEPLVWPMRGTSGPWYLFNRELGLPTVKDGGLGHGKGFHAPNEYLVLETDGDVGGLVECEKSHVEVLYSYAAYPNDY